MASTVPLNLLHQLVPYVEHAWFCPTEATVCVWLGNAFPGT